MTHREGGFPQYRAIGPTQISKQGHSEILSSYRIPIPSLRHVEVRLIWTSLYRALYSDPSFPNMFKRVHRETWTVAKRAVSIRLKYLLVTVCQSFCSRRRCTPSGGHPPSPLRRHPLGRQHPKPATATDGTNPTGMHSCF